MKYLKYFEEDLFLEDTLIISLKDLNLPKHVSGYLNIRSNQLTSLEFCPEYVDGNFNCSDNELTSLEFCPEFIGGDFYCSHNLLTSLEFCPEMIGGGFSCLCNKLTSLEFSPKSIDGNFNCSNNQLTSLEFCPEFIGGDFYCSHNNWTNPISYYLMIKYNFDITNLYTIIQYEKFSSYEFQKEFLNKTPEKYKDLEFIGYNDKIKEEFDWLFNASDMGLM